MDNYYVNVRVMEDQFRIGDLARESGKTVRALRYYEELGLLEPSAHTEGGFRLYQREDLRRVQLLNRLQDLGFSLDRIGGILGAWKRGGTGEGVSQKLKSLLTESLQDTRERIRRLQGMQGEIQEALNFLDACGSCQDRPAREVCSECQKGDHHARLPTLMEGLVR